MEQRAKHDADWDTYGDDNPFILVDVADIHDGRACTEGESIVNKRENPTRNGCSG